MEKPRPTQSAEPPLALPIPNAPPAPEPVLNSRLVEYILFPNRWLCEEVMDRTGFSAHIRMNRLLRESEDLLQAREEFHRFWMNNQPSVLTFDRLNGAIGP